VAISTSTLEAKHQISLEPIGTYLTGLAFQDAAEIPTYDPVTQRVFVVNSQAAAVDVLDISDPTNPSFLFSIDVTSFGRVANSVDVHDGVVVVAVENAIKTEPGVAAFFDTDGKAINSVTVGALPDMITYSPNGRWVLVANEGEPNDEYTVDPEGSVSIINVSGGAANISQSDVRTAGFSAFNNAVLDPSIRIYGPNATVAQDLEPEYITISKNSRQAWVVLQENNALGVIDIKNAEVADLIGLGTKDHTLAENAFDASNEDGGINFAVWPTLGMYQPDAIDSYRFNSNTYLVTANEGDSRDYSGFSEEARVKDVVLDPSAFPDAVTLQDPAALGRLKITTANGDIDGDGDFDELYSYGARSFSIWTANGDLVFDSADEIEQITATELPDGFNSNGTNDSFDSRSDDKGPEAEGVVLGKAFGRTFAFVGLERIGGIMVYDVSDPYNAFFVEYVNTGIFDGDPGAGTAGDVGPEGLKFIKAEDSPTGEPLLVVAYEVSGSTTIFRIAKD
jgi:hypothetical protein